MCMEKLFSRCLRKNRNISIAKIRVNMERAVNVRPGVGVTACIRQQTELTVCRAVIERPTIISVRRGTKCLRNATQEHVIEAGSAIAIAGGQSFDITNRPAANGDYEAFWLVWDPSILLAYQGKTPIQQAMLIRPMETGFQEAYDRAREAIINPANVPSEIAIHRLKEVLVWLQMHGGCFEIPRPTSAAAQVRAILNSAPHHTWTAMDGSRNRQTISDERSYFAPPLTGGKSFAHQNHA